MALLLDSPPETLSYDPQLVEHILDALTPRERLPVTEWATTYYEIPAGNQKAGPYRWDNTPWMEEIISRLDPDDPAQDVVFVKPSQIGATVGGTIWAGHTIDQDPSNFLYVSGTKIMAKDHMIQRMNKLISSCPVVNEKMYAGGRKMGVNNVFDKEFEGGLFKAVGTVSPDGLRSMASMRIHFDEVDAMAFDAGGEGDPLELAKDRSESFKFSRKHFYTSTPLQLETSRIWPLFLSGDRRRFYIPCPRCEFSQCMKWRQVKWDNQDYSSARYECEQCGQPWTDGERIRATQAGEWIPEIPWTRFIPRSYHLTGRMYSHMVELPRLVQEWLAAQNRPERLSHFSHTVLGEPSSDQSMYAYETDTLMQRREVYPVPCPAGVQRITAGIDVQDNRIEMVAVGWGWQEEAWILDHHVFYGETEQPEVWDDLQQAISTPYRGVDSDYWIDALAIDQRYKEHEVVAFTRRKSQQHTRLLWGIKGAREDGTDSKSDIWPRKVTVKNRGKRKIELMQQSYFSINTFAAKQVIYARCKYPPPGAATWHFPMHLGQDFFDQFTSEALISERRGAKVVRRWKVKENRRNEVLDCMVYALAALRGLYTMNVQLIMPVDDDEHTPEKPPAVPARAREEAVPTPAPAVSVAPVQGWQPRKFPIAGRR